MRQFSRIAVTALVVTLATACTSLTSGDRQGDNAQGNSKSEEPYRTCCAGPKPKQPVFPPSARSIYFGFDQYVVDAEGAKVIEANRQFMREKADATLRLEGNTDDHGGREYNLALGQKRAEAVLRQLALLGVPVQRIEVVSFGEEKPAANGDQEEARAKNRRVDFVYDK